MSFSLPVLGLVLVSLSTGLVAGVFLTFSDFVMKSLFAATPAAGTEAMQIINRKVYSSLFMVLLIGLVPVSALLVAYGVAFLSGQLRAALMGGGLLYFLGVFVVSVVGNIPMNHKLDAMAQGGSQAQLYWPDYVRGWVLCNHLRWVSAFGASACYAMAAVLLVATHQ